ncbi:DUF6788 family protein [Alicyclobacillus cycloheptanicus]|uniref:DUF6788 domain-containing protein n=1 Tax=Alicyclobacillus cycloheptanicus TaxID=1457 RepID=A0ABT9XD88_9BACL|nr:hypothetical protein [Alicyclobacillus cycloheptanicus]
MAVHIDGWSVVPQYRKCGKGNCKVCHTGKGHGPYYYGTRLQNGKRCSKYFGQSLPDTQDDTQDEIRPLQQELAEAKRLIAVLQAENATLRKQLQPTSVRAAEELSQADVEQIWARVVKNAGDMSENVLQTAYSSLIRGLFGKGNTYTRLHTGRGGRPYVCPFRGPRFRYKDPVRLVETAAKWIIINEQIRQDNKAELRKKREAIERYGTLI